MRQMGRKAKITKEMVLQAAFDLLDEGGINAVAIKSIAAKLECSTQPISWIFGSMMDLKRELYKFAADRMWEGIADDMGDKDAVHAFFETGVRYITNACDHPHVFRFLYIDNLKDTLGDGLKLPEGMSVFTVQFDPMAVEVLAKEYNVPKEKIGEAVQNTVIYTHGLATMMMWDDFKMPKETAIEMVYNMGITLLRDIGIEIQDT